MSTSFELAASSVALPTGLGLNPGGHAQNRHRFRAVSHPLEANLALLRQGESKLLLASLDVLYVGPKLRTHLERQLAPDLQPAEIFLAASHTHSAPLIDSTKPKLGDIDEDYADQVGELLVDSIRSLLDGPAEAVSVEVSRGYQKQGVKRRRMAIKRSGIRIVRGPSRLGSGKLPIKRARFVRASDGRALAEMWSTPMHPTSNPAPDSVSSDFPGFIRDSVRGKYGANLPLLYFQGFGGDIAPRFSTVPGLILREYFVPFSKTELKKWTAQLLECFNAVEWADPGPVCLRVARERVEAEKLFVGSLGNRSGYVHVVSLAEDFKIVGFPFELSHRWFAKLFGRNSSGIWGVGCIDDVFGYLATPLQRALGGYEGKDFLTSFGLQGLLPKPKRQLRKPLFLAMAHIGGNHSSCCDF